MLKYILKRMGYTLLSIVILLTLLFFLMQLIPGYPIEQGIQETNEQFERRLTNLGLDKDPVTQYLVFWKDLFLYQKFGIDFQRPTISVIETFMRPIKYTLMIALPAFIISSILGIFLGVIAAYFRGKWQDTLINLFSVIFVSIPSFVMALYLVQFAGLISLPTNFIAPESNGYTFEKMITSLIIPITSMILTSTSTVVYFTRNEMVEVFKQEYMRTALSKGMKFRTVVFKHGFRNASIPILYTLLPSLLSILSGSIIIEQFFNVPGTAKAIVESIQTKNFYVIMFSAIFYSGIYYVLQIFFDVLSTFIDPRIKLGEMSNKSLFNQIKSFFKRNSNQKNISKEEKELSENTRMSIEFEKNQSMMNFSFSGDEIIQFNENKPVVLENKYGSIEQEKFEKVDIEKLDLFDNISGKPSKQWVDVLTRFASNKWALFFSGLFFLIVLLAIFVPIFGQAVEDSITTKAGNLTIFLPPRVPWLGLTGETKTVVGSDIFEILNSYNAIKSYRELSAGLYEVVYNPYKVDALKDMYPLFGTDASGRDWWNVLWISTSQSLLMAFIVSALSTIIGAIYGAIAGYNAGKPIDNILMRIVEILSGVPTIVWILIVSIVFSHGLLDSFTIAASLIFVGWIWPAMTTRVFIMKYKDLEYIEASRTLGASNSRLIFSHLLPNVSGKLMVRFVNQIPKTIFFETSLVFLGLVLPSSSGLGSMIEIARQTGYFNLLLAPTLVIILITLSAQIIANAFNDALDPKVSGE